ncbi:hypothetical protein M758_4G134600 [Ceratodon purpureus]|uniref:Uncharacterized protein n=1 Tax=Ceratodon purpureus TaxID=3225 RepID=A0A8T0I8I3_CERPU|nr:hypothetical protein KC19_4G133300 [Ceratodon purpureus]KAG0619367.1 hypothetical protein M758_4G134600 [Ceratodon purpureus]
MWLLNCLFCSSLPFVMFLLIFILSPVQLAGISVESQRCGCAILHNIVSEVSLSFGWFHSVL